MEVSAKRPAGTFEGNGPEVVKWSGKAVDGDVAEPELQTKRPQDISVRSSGEVKTYQECAGHENLKVPH